MTIQISCFSEITGDWEAGQMVQAAGLGEMRSNGEQKKLELRMEMALKGCQAAETGGGRCGGGGAKRARGR